MPEASAHPTKPAILITCGPTHEPIDAVRYIGNRSSGRMGLSIASAAAKLGWTVRLLAGPGVNTSSVTGDTRITVRMFRTAADLEALLGEEFLRCDVLVMAAAVADYRPVRSTDDPDATGKIRRSDAGLSIQMEATPDLLAGCARTRRPGQTLVGFALEPTDRLMTSARSKLDRKNVDAIVANPLETMDSPTIEGVLVTRAGASMPAGAQGTLGASGAGRLSKEAFASWLMDQIAHMHAAGPTIAPSGVVTTVAPAPVQSLSPPLSPGR